MDQETFQAMVKLAKRVYLDSGPDETAHRLAGHVLRLNDSLRDGGNLTELQTVQHVVY